MKDFLYFLFAIPSSIFLVIVAIAFFRAKDIFTMIQVVMIANLYVIPMILISIEIHKFHSFTSIGKMTIFILLNLLTSIFFCHIISSRAMANKITPDAEITRKSILG